MSIAASDRAAGRIVGAFIGDALGLGPHWYYDLDELRRDFGDCIDGCTAPKPDAKYLRGMKAPNCASGCWSSPKLPLNS